ncbi:MAG: ATP-binding protein [Victivallales bacterium]|nr:ATP-binding protein [Victivallales bacterium]
MFKRIIFDDVLKRIIEPRKFIQVLAGPRQVGKTTLSRQLMDEVNIPTHYASADEPTLKNSSWLEQQWEVARYKIKNDSAKNTEALLVLDEIQKLQNWSEIVKRLWDEDSFNNTQLKVILLGSSPLLIKSGLTESLAGRFELVPLTHWSYSEMKDAFGFNFEQYVYFGGYPGAVNLIDDIDRWTHYIKESLIETSISRDILLMTRVDKPALLRRMFELGCAYSGQILSYQKMTGQLQDAGNTTTLAHYLDLLSSAGFVIGLQKYAGQQVRRRSSSPKLQVFNTALMTAHANIGFDELVKNRDLWGRWVESTVGAHLLNQTIGRDLELYYWSKSNMEVDFVLVKGDKVTAIEVKGGAKSVTLPGIDAFSKEFNVSRKLLVGAQGIPLEEFLMTPVSDWL